MLVKLLLDARHVGVPWPENWAWARSLYRTHWPREPSETAPGTTSTHVAEHVTQYRETKTPATVRPPKATATRNTLSNRPQVTFDGSIRTNPLCHLHCPQEPLLIAIEEKNGPEGEKQSRCDDPHQESGAQRSTEMREPTVSPPRLRPPSSKSSATTPRTGCRTGRAETGFRRQPLMDWRLVRPEDQWLHEQLANLFSARWSPGRYGSYWAGRLVP